MTEADIRITLNHAETSFSVDPRQSLAEALRDRQNLKSVHIGCAQGHCGTCNILLDGALVRGCLVFSCQVDGCDILTAEGILGDTAFHGIREALIRHRALQCGYCTPGFVVLLASALHGKLDPTEARRALSANLCRCTGYVGLMAALEDLLGSATAPAPSSATESA